MLKILSKTELNRLLTRVPIVVTILVLLVLMLTLVVSMVSLSNLGSFAQEAQLDSSQMKLISERVDVTVNTRAQYEFLKTMVAECPPFDSTHGEPWEFVINQWQRKQLEQEGIRVRVLPEPKLDEGANRAEYELVKEIDLEKEQLGSLVFGPKSSTPSTVSYMVQRDHREILFYSRDFSLLNAYKQTEHYTDLFPSKNLEYVGLLTPLKIPTTDEPVGRTRFTLVSSEGLKVWEMERDVYYDVGNSGYSVSDGGIVIERNHSSGMLTFYDRMGKETKSIRLYTASGDPGAQGIRGEFSDDGKYALIMAGDDSYSSFGNGEGVFLFTSDGEELWNLNTEDKGMGVARISSLDDYIIVSTKGTTYLLSIQGNQIERFEHLFATGACFSSTDRYALLTEHYHTCYLILSQNGEIVSKYTTKGGLRYIYSTDIAEDARRFGLISGFGAEYWEVLVIGFDGRKIWANRYPFEGGGQSLRLTDDGKQIEVQIGSKIMVYRQIR